MDFILSEEQKQIKALMRDFCKKEIDVKKMVELHDKAATVRTVEELRANYPVELVKKLHDVGLRQLAVPKKYGGTAPESEGNLTRAIAIEEAGYSGGPASTILTSFWNHCRGVELGHYTEEQKEWFFSQVMENHSMMTAGAFSEPSGMTDQIYQYDEPPGTTIKTFAYKDGNEWVINGEKMFSTVGGVADLIQVGIRTDKKAHMSQAMTFFWVPKDAPGMTMTLNRMIFGDLGGNVQIHFDNVRVPESLMMGEVNKGLLNVLGIFATKWIHWAALVGEAQRIYEEVVDYAKERIQGGKPIIQHPNIAAMLGEAAANLEATRTFMYRAACETDQWEKSGGPVNLFWTEASLYLSKKMLLRLCEIAADVYGGIGMSVDMPLESFVRHVYYFSHGASTTNMNAIQACKEYNG